MGGKWLPTLMIQRILARPEWRNALTPEDLRALTPLLFAHVTPYGSLAGLEVLLEGSCRGRILHKRRYVGRLGGRPGLCSTAGA